MESQPNLSFMLRDLAEIQCRYLIIKIHWVLSKNEHFYLNYFVLTVETARDSEDHDGV